MKHKDHGLSSGTMKTREDLSNAQLNTPWLISKLCRGGGSPKEEKAIPHSVQIIWLSLQNTPLKIFGDRECAVCMSQELFKHTCFSSKLIQTKHWLRSPLGSLGSDYPLHDDSFPEAIHGAAVL